ncbi:MAG: hypothetical protein ACO3JZ_05675 [Schleiferiaceae bacterium]|nr:hypothetical protein [Schleiferiaceae bacterium]MDA8819222.1 hypothetical protein [Schleiferiaceae bacterium]PSR07735.1 MAG: hypothetical protein C7N14_02860 [Bacteroidota bacterium]
MKNRRILDYFAGFFVGIGAPIFSIAIALENYPMLADIGDIGNPAWRLVVMRAITFGVIINAVLFFTAINFEKDRVARGILLSCLPSVAAIVLFQFILR